MDETGYRTRLRSRGHTGTVTNDEGDEKGKIAASGRAVLGDVSNRGSKGSKSDGNATKPKSTAATGSTSKAGNKPTVANAKKTRKAAPKRKATVAKAKPKSASRGKATTRKKAGSKAKPARSQPGSKRAGESGKPDDDVRSTKRRRSSGTSEEKLPSSSRTVAKTRSSTRAATRKSIRKSFGDDDDEKRKDEAEILIVSDDSCIVPPEFRLKRDSFDGKNHTRGIAHYDAPNMSNPLLCIDYVTDIFQHMYQNETSTHPKMYMDAQDDINAKMRAILVDWLVEVHMKFRLAPETLYLCVNILDRYCSKIDVQRSKLQLIGVTALLVACKHEEIYPPEVRDCVYITDRAYDRQEVLDMEQSILKELNWKISVPTAFPFIHRYLSIVDASPLTKHAAAYYMERSLQEHDMLEFRPSLVCVAAVILALNNPDIRIQEQKFDRDLPGVPKILMEYTEFSESEVLHIAKLVAKKVGEEPITASRRQLVAVKRKYESKKYMEVSSDVELPSYLHIVANMNSRERE